MPRHTRSQPPPTDFMRANLADRIKDARVAVGKTQAELAEDLGMTASWASMVERGVINPYASDLWRIARDTGFPMAWFFGEGTSPNDYKQPETLPEWIMMYPDDPARAQSHFGIDQVFRGAPKNGGAVKHLPGEVAGQPNRARGTNQRPNSRPKKTIF